MIRVKGVCVLVLCLIPMVAGAQPALPRSN
jgi:hypothetical protein